MPRWWRSRTHSKPARVRYRRTDRRIWNKAARILRSNGQAYLDAWLARQKPYVAPAPVPAAWTPRPYTASEAARVPWAGYAPPKPASVNGYLVWLGRMGDDQHVWIPDARAFAGALRFTCSCGLTELRTVVREETEATREEARRARQRSDEHWERERARWAMRSRTFERQRELGKLRYRRPEPVREAVRPPAYLALEEVYGVRPIR